ncbi:hypothetical protein CRENBAI_018875 [Crenichthys baileyi]|uniref:Uncharacterized protein n=1 Tax=Crenichthys baileyi TaxID=28760 RepID=A0AAV9R3K6_9TELE
MRRTSLTLNFGNSKRHLVNFVDSAITPALPYTNRKHRTILTLNEEVMHAPSALSVKHKGSSPQAREVQGEMWGTPDQATSPSPRASPPSSQGSAPTPGSKTTQQQVVETPPRAPNMPAHQLTNPLWQSELGRTKHRSQKIPEPQHSEQTLPCVTATDLPEEVKIELLAQMFQWYQHCLLHPLHVLLRQVLSRLVVCSMPWTILATDLPEEVKIELLAQGHIARACALSRQMTVQPCPKKDVPVVLALTSAPSPRAARTGRVKAGGLLYVLDHSSWTQQMRYAIDQLMPKHHGQKDFLAKVDAEYAAVIQAASRDPNSLLHPTTKQHISRYVKHLDDT